jgi:tRNA 2-thiouridine synthesizing protein A
MKETLDLRGIACPLSWAKAKVRLETLAKGDELVLLLDDPKGARDIPRAAEAAGYAVTHFAEGADGWRLTIAA